MSFKSKDPVTKIRGFRQAKTAAQEDLLADLNERLSLALLLPLSSFDEHRKAIMRFLRLATHPVKHLGETTEAYKTLIFEYAVKGLRFLRLSLQHLFHMTEPIELKKYCWKVYEGSQERPKPDGVVPGSKEERLWFMKTQLDLECVEAADCVFDLCQGEGKVVNMGERKGRFVFEPVVDMGEEGKELGLRAWVGVVAWVARCFERDREDVFREAVAGW